MHSHSTHEVTRNISHSKQEDLKSGLTFEFCYSCYQNPFHHKQIKSEFSNQQTQTELGEMMGSKLALFKELSLSQQNTQFSERTIRTTFVRKDQSNGIPLVSHLGAIKMWFITIHVTTFVL